jgi:guanylate kinase
LALKKTALKARYILITTKDEQVREQRLKTRQLGQSEPNDAHQWIDRSVEDLKMDFDLTIVNDDLEVAYQQLKEFCLERYWHDFEKDE